MTSKQDPLVITAEDIALLSVIRQEVVDPPSVRNPSTYTHSDAGRGLPLQNEERLVSILSRMSGTSHDQFPVTAVCVQENGPAALDVLVAANSDRQTDNEEWFRGQESGFNRVFGLLGKIEGAGPVDSRIREDVFHAIVEMCRARIKTRMRLSEKCTIFDALEKTEREISLQSDCAPGKGAFILHAKKLLDYFRESAAKNRVESGLPELVDGFRTLSRLPACQEVISTASNSVLDPSQLSWLFRTATRVGQYRDMAIHLIHLARLHPQVRNMRFISVSLAASFFAPAKFPSSYKSDMTGALARVAASQKRGWRNVDDECATFLGQKPADLKTRFEKRVWEVLTSSRVHAEIQLATYYEVGPGSAILPGSRPRVISSSKKSCFLCQTFIATHGKFFMAKGHGRIYHNWRLPAGVDKTWTRMLNTALEERVGRCLRGMERVEEQAGKWSGEPEMRYFYPIESSTVSAAVSASAVSLRPQQQSVDSIARKMIEKDAAAIKGKSTMVYASDGSGSKSESDDESELDQDLNLGSIPDLEAEADVNAETPPRPLAIQSSSSYSSSLSLDRKLKATAVATAAAAPPQPPLSSNRGLRKEVQSSSHAGGKPPSRRPPAVYPTISTQGRDRERERDQPRASCLSSPGSTTTGSVRPGRTHSIAVGDFLGLHVGYSHGPSATVQDQHHPMSMSPPLRNQSDKSSRRNGTMPPRKGLSAKAKDNDDYSDKRVFGAGLTGGPFPSEHIRMSRRRRRRQMSTTSAQLQSTGTRAGDGKYREHGEIGETWQDGRHGRYGDYGTYGNDRNDRNDVNQRRPVVEEDQGAMKSQEESKFQESGRILNFKVSWLGAEDARAVLEGASDVSDPPDEAMAAGGERGGRGERREQDVVGDHSDWWTARSSRSYLAVEGQVVRIEIA